MRYLELCKIRIAIFASLSSVLGFFLKTPRFGAGASDLALGVFFLACGAGALNQYLEREIDGRMPRTAKRPLPSGKIAAPYALVFSAALSLSGLIFLFSLNRTAAALGLITSFLYNGIYVPLKRKSAIAFIPGALVGAFPPLIGWVSAGGTLFDRPVLFVCSFFLLWQVLHSLLLFLHYGAEYLNAGLPSPTLFFSRTQLSRIILSWTCAASVSGIFLALTLISSRPVLAALLAISIWPVWRGISLIRAGGTKGVSIFREMNSYLAAQVCLLLLGKCLDFYS